jgi:hypothetical protein
MQCVPDSHSIDVRSVTVRLLVEVTWSFACSCEPQGEAQLSLQPFKIILEPWRPWLWVQGLRTRCKFIDNARMGECNTIPSDCSYTAGRCSC